jgi:hypothetical protein
MTRARWTGLAGVLFALSMVLIPVLAGTTPDIGADDAPDRFARYWSDTSHQSDSNIAALILSYAFLLLIAFVAGLHSRLRAVDRGPLPTLVLAAGAAAAVLILVGGQISFVTGVAADMSDGFKVDGSTALLLDNLGYQILAPALMAAAVMTTVTGIITLRTRVLPAWTAWLGFLIGLAALGSYFSAWSGFFALPAWSVLVGLVLLFTNDTVTEADARAEA